MSSIIGNAVGTVVATQLPFDNATNMALGMASNQLTQGSLRRFGTLTEWIWNHIGWSLKTIKVNVKENGKLNPIHKKLGKIFNFSNLKKLTHFFNRRIHFEYVCRRFNSM